MSRLLRNSWVLLLACSPIVLPGCQHPLAPSAARQRPARIGQTLVATDATTCGTRTRQFSAPIAGAEVCALDLDLDLAESPQPKDEPAAASVQKEPECATVQLGDDFAHLLKLFTGR